MYRVVVSVGWSPGRVSARCRYEAGTRVICRRWPSCSDSAMLRRWRRGGSLWRHGGGSSCWWLATRLAWTGVGGRRRVFDRHAVVSVLSEMSQHCAVVTRVNKTKHFQNRSANVLCAILGRVQGDRNERNCNDTVQFSSVQFSSVALLCAFGYSLITSKYFPKYLC